MNSGISVGHMTSDPPTHTPLIHFGDAGLEGGLDYSVLSELRSSHLIVLTASVKVSLPQKGASTYALAYASPPFGNCSRDASKIGVATSIKTASYLQQGGEPFDRPQMMLINDQRYVSIAVSRADRIPNTKYSVVTVVTCPLESWKHNALYVRERNPVVPGSFEPSRQVRMRQVRGNFRPCFSSYSNRLASVRLQRSRKQSGCPGPTFYPTLEGVAGPEILNDLGRLEYPVKIGMIGKLKGKQKGKLKESQNFKLTHWIMLHKGKERDLYTLAAESCGLSVTTIIKTIMARYSHQTTSVKN
ncbi:hypothetical protein H4582DRAFT_2055209 [Lactarius indigo]|nr:hypothetical protein H4582DRAFT_2055209 [Lactarius indigo]